MSIWFYSKTPGYEFLSNFAHSPFELEGQRWDTIEHWYQASKYAFEAASSLIRNAPSASLARQLGQDHSLPRCTEFVAGSRTAEVEVPDMRIDLIRTTSARSRWLRFIWEHA